MQAKNPDVTYYQVVNKLAIMSEDFAYGCKEFPTFGLKPKDMPNKVKEILNKYLPF